jgi:hypothetical protein
VVKALLDTADRAEADGNSDNLQSSAYNALNILFVSAPDECIDLVKEFVPIIFSRFSSVINNTGISVEETIHRANHLSYLCTLLQVRSDQGRDITRFVTNLSVRW